MTCYKKLFCCCIELFRPGQNIPPFPISLLLLENQTDNAPPGNCLALFHPLKHFFVAHARSRKRLLGP